MRDYREIVCDAEMLQEVTLRSYCLQETIMAHSEVCMYDAVMCKHLHERVCVCALTASSSSSSSSSSLHYKEEWA